MDLAPQGEFATVQLRAPTESVTDAVLLARPDDAAPWEELATTRGPGGVFGAAFPGPGDVQLAVPTGAAPAPSGSAVLPALCAAGVLVLFVVGLALRRRRS